MIATSSNQKLRGVGIKMMVKGGVFLEKKICTNASKYLKLSNLTIKNASFPLIAVSQ
jgi:hypothetical protein